MDLPPLEHRPKPGERIVFALTEELLDDLVEHNYSSNQPLVDECIRLYRLGKTILPAVVVSAWHHTDHDGDDNFIVLDAPEDAGDGFNYDTLELDVTCPALEAHTPNGLFSIEGVDAREVDEDDRQELENSPEYQPVALSADADAVLEVINDYSVTIPALTYDEGHGYWQDENGETVYAVAISAEAVTAHCPSCAATALRPDSVLFTDLSVFAKVELLSQGLNGKSQRCISCQRPVIEIDYRRNRNGHYQDTLPVAAKDHRPAHSARSTLLETLRDRYRASRQRWRRQ